MKDKMNNGFYCTADYFDTYGGGICKDPCGNSPPKCHTLCKHLHRKHPTPEQYKKEYGEEYSDSRPVWVWHDYSWQLMLYGEAKTIWQYKTKYDKFFVVCICTPFDKPDRDWRP